MANSSSLSSSIYLRVKRGKILSDWYMVENDELHNLCSPEPEHDKNALSNSAILGSKLYIIGGRQINYENPFYWYEFYCGKQSADVFYIDIHCPDEGWKIGPSLLRPRANPCVTVVDGKIYVFGGSPYGTPPWGEFFDPCCGQWFPLGSDAILSEVYSSVTAHALLNKDTFLFHSPISRQLYYFNVADGSSGIYNHGKQFGEFKGKCVLLDGILYFAITRLFAYNVETREWCESVEGLEQEGVLPKENHTYRFAPSLYYLGNDRLCLVYTSNHCGGEIFANFNVNVITFGITKQRQEKQQIKQQTKQSFPRTKQSRGKHKHQTKQSQGKHQIFESYSIHLVAHSIQH